jgi:hypothetical protein
MSARGHEDRASSVCCRSREARPSVPRNAPRRVDHASCGTKRRARACPRVSTLIDFTRDKWRTIACGPASVDLLRRAQSEPCEGRLHAVDDATLRRLVCCGLAKGIPLSERIASGKPPRLGAGDRSAREWCSGAARRGNLPPATLPLAQRRAAYASIMSTIVRSPLGSPRCSPGAHLRTPLAPAPGAWRRP